MTDRSDRTFDVARERVSEEIEDGRLTGADQAECGKAEALNFALDHVEEEIYVGIDADTVIARRCGIKAGLPFCRSAGGRGRRECKGGQSHQPVDAVAGAGIHHEPEFRAPRDGSVQCGDGGSGRDRRVADRRGEERRMLSGKYRGGRCGFDHESAGAALQGDL